MKVSVPPGLGCSPAGAGVCEPPPVAFGEHAASASAKVSKSAATRRYVTTRTTPSARTLAHALPTDDLFVEFNELRCDVGPVVLGSPPRPRFADAHREAHVLDPVGAHETPQPAEERADAAEDEPDLRVLLLELGVRLHEIHRALARLEAPDEQDVDLPVRVLG